MRKRIVRLAMLFVLCVGIGYASAQALSARPAGRGAMVAAWGATTGTAAAGAQTAANGAALAGAAGLAGALPLSTPVAGVESSAAPTAPTATLPTGALPDGTLPLDAPIAGDPVPGPSLRTNDRSNRTPAPVAVALPTRSRRDVPDVTDPAPPTPAKPRAESESAIIALEEEFNDLSARYSAIAEFYKRMERTVESNGGALRTALVTRLGRAQSSLDKAEAALEARDGTRARASLARARADVKFLEDEKER